MLAYHDESIANPAWRELFIDSGRMLNLGTGRACRNRPPIAIWGSNRVRGISLVAINHNQKKDMINLFGSLKLTINPNLSCL